MPRARPNDPPPRRRTPAWRIAWPLAAAGILAGCGTAAKAAPSWVPQPSVTLEASPPGSAPAEPPQSNGPNGSGVPLPGPTAPGGSGPQSGSNGGSGVLATRLTAPTGVVLLPDGSALVGERTTGRILHVQPKPGQPVPVVRTIGGLSTAGGGGLLDLALSPTYAEDGLIYAYITTPSDNRVIDFTLTGQATPVLTGIPRGATHNAGRLAFDHGGRLFVGTGDAGSPQRAADPRSLAGKVLRVDGIGQVAPGNPTAGSPVFTRGHSTVDGLCTDPARGAVYETQAPNEINILVAGAAYGRAPGDQRPADTLPARHTGAAGCAVLSGALFVATADGQALLQAPITKSGRLGPLRVVDLGQDYGRLRTVVAAPDGALWLTTTNKDGHGHPRADDERVIRIVPVPASGGGSPV